MSTKIEWADRVWNPTTGCTRVSAGCEHCYIERQTPMRIAHRKFDGPAIGATLPVQLHPERLGNPLRWRKPERIFVNSMSDLFHDDVPGEFIARVFATMAAAPQHTFLILTKRPARMRALLGDAGQNLLEHTTDEETAAAIYDAAWPLPNVWLGVSTESQRWADIRIPQLLDTPAAVRWISAEPLLGPIDLDGQLDDTGHHRPKLTYWLTGRPHWGEPTPTPPNGLLMSPLEVGPRLDWVVVGGETGPGARPMHPDWARSLRDQCTVAGVPYFFKQHGDWAPIGPLYGAVDGSDADEVDDAHMAAVILEVDERREIAQMEPNGVIVLPEERQAAEGTWLMARLGKKRAGRQLDGRTWDEFPGVMPS
ncbi:phage Gp37/Gp68 family protein [Nocardia sp. NPDC050630]|uniref:phage Gp37/Gp68 family protein n=1 Tax=Nocardia sp. NPDC050630 TaxID=3364321 RepID=UPI0037A7D37E